MDGIALWLLFLLFLPFLLFFWKMLLIAWKSFLLTKKIKNLSDEIEINPNESYTVNDGYAAYGCVFGILVIVFILLIIKMTLNRKKIHTRNAALRQNIARQHQLSTVSHSIDANSNYSNEGPNNRNRRDSDATLKIDLPPTYDEVMKNFADARERAATSATSTEGANGGGDGAVETRNTHGNVRIEIDAIPVSDQRSVV